MRKLLSFLVGQSWLRKGIVSLPGVRDLAWRFVAGEDLSAGISTLQNFNAQGIKGTLNFIGTHVREEEEAVGAADAAIEALYRVDKEGLDANLSVKLTQIGLDIDEKLCLTQLRRILECADKLGNFVCIDMEEAKYTDTTLRIFEEMLEIFGPEVVGIVLQSYLRNRTRDLQRLLEKGSNIRLVKGGYWESAEIAYRKKADIDKAFEQDLELLLRQGRRPAIATHDARFILKAKQLATEVGIEPSSFEVQFLYGVRPDLQKSLVDAGYTVRCYIPYGGNWYAYMLGCVRRIPGGFMRQAKEGVRTRLS